MYWVLVYYRGGSQEEGNTDRHITRVYLLDTSRRIFAYSSLFAFMYLFLYFFFICSRHVQFLQHLEITQAMILKMGHLSQSADVRATRLEREVPLMIEGSIIATWRPSVLLFMIWPLWSQIVREGMGRPPRFQSRLEEGRRLSEVSWRHFISGGCRWFRWL